MSREEKQVELKALIEPVVEDLGFELVKLSYAAQKNGLLHLIIDHPAGITIDQCEKVSRAVSDLLDLHDLIKHAYSLEVSSPGLERPLTKLEHFIRFVGKKAKIKTKADQVEVNKYSGTIVKADQENVLLKKEDGTEVDIPYELISKANLWYIKPGKNK